MIIDILIWCVKSILSIFYEVELEFELESKLDDSLLPNRCDAYCVFMISAFFTCGYHPRGGGRGGVRPPKKWIGVYSLLPKTLTLFMTIYLSAIFPTLFMT